MLLLPLDSNLTWEIMKEATSSLYDIWKKDGAGKQVKLATVFEVEVTNIIYFQLGTQENNDIFPNTSLK